jgi:hypothetical protein
MDLQMTSRKNLILLIVVAVVAFCAGQATSSRYELSNRSDSLLLDKRTGVLYFRHEGKWSKFADF